MPTFAEDDLAPVAQTNGVTNGRTFDESDLTPAANDPGDFTDKYNTPIPAAKLPAFNQWADSQKAKTGKDPRNDRYDYDVNGFFLSGGATDERGHSSDQFKKPNHPTFSDQSIYHGTDGYQGGHWVEQNGQYTGYQPSATNFKFHDPGELQQYFKDEEPDTKLLTGDPLKKKITRAEDLPSDEHLQAHHDAYVQRALADPTGIIGTTLLGMPGGVRQSQPAVHGGQPVTARDIPQPAPLPGTPASRLKEAVNTPAIPFSKLAPDNPTTIPGEVGKHVAQFAEGLTTPGNVLLAAGTEGLGLLAKPALGVAKYLPRAVSAVFGAQMLKGAIDSIPEVKDAIAKKDYQRAAGAITDVALSGGMAGLALLHAGGAHAGGGDREAAVTQATQPQPETIAPSTEINTPVSGTPSPSPEMTSPESVPTGAQNIPQNIPAQTGGLTPEQQSHLADIDKILAPIEQPTSQNPPANEAVNQEVPPAAGPVPMEQPAPAPPVSKESLPPEAEPVSMNVDKPQLPKAFDEADLTPVEQLSSHQDGDFAKPADNIRAESKAEPQAFDEKDLTPVGKDDGSLPIPGSIRQMNPNDINLDPARFQFKQQGIGQKGVSDQFKEVTKWDPHKAGLLQVWRDPEDGKTYAVDSHHRTELAQRLNPPEGVTAQYIEAKDASQARVTGAMLNLAAGNGDPLDFAKVIRDTGKTEGDLRDEGINMKGEKVRQGLALANLDPSLFRKVIDGDLKVNRAVIIGEGLPEHADQKAILDLADGKTTDGQLAEMIRMSRDTPKTTETQESLFGTQEATRSLIKEKAEVSDYIRKRLGQEKKLFETVGNEGAAAKLAESGNDIKAAENARVAERTAQVQALYDKLSTSSGPVSDELNNAAALLGSGETSRDVKERAYKTIKSGLIEQARALSGESAGGEPEAGAPRGGPEAGTGEHDRPLYRGRPARPEPETVGGGKFYSPDRKIAESYAGPKGVVEERANDFQNVLRAKNWAEAKKAAGLPQSATMADLVNKARDLGHDAVSFTTKNGLEFVSTEQPKAKPKGRAKLDQLRAESTARTGLSDNAPPASQKRLSDVLNDTSGSYKPGWVNSVKKATVEEITKGFDEMKALKDKRDRAMAALERSKETPEDHRFGQKVIEAYTGERDLWQTRVNQAIEKLQRIVPDHVDQEALAIMRDFKHKPEELAQWRDKSHPSLDTMATGDREAAERNIERLRPAIERAMDPTPAMEAADKVLTRISTATLKEGQKLGFLESRWTPDEYVPHILHPKGEGDVAKPIMDSVGRLLGGKIGKRFAFAETREFPTLLDAVANNYKPKTLNALDAFAIHGDKFATARATHILVQQLHDTGVGIVGNDRNKMPEGYVELARHSPEFRYVTAQSPEEKVQAFGGELTKPSETVKGALYVPKIVDKALKPITDPDFMGTVGGWQKMRNFQSYTKAVQLGISMFHATTENYMALANMGPRGWARALAADRTSIPFLQGERDFIAHGGTTSILGKTIEAYKSLQPGSIPRWSEIIRSAPGIRHMDQIAGHINEFTFGKLQRQFKVTDYALHKAAWMGDHPEASNDEISEASQSIAKEINAVYGGLHWENLGANKATTEILKGLMLAPDWTISNIFNVKYATENSPAGDLARRFWMRQIAGGLAATQLASLMFSHKPSKNLTQVYMGKDREGKDIYQNIFFKGVSGDVINMVHNVADYGAVQGLARTLAGKAAPLPRAAIQLISNRDYFGHEIAPKGMNPVASTARAATETAKTLAPVPLSLQNAWDMLLGPHAKKYTLPEVLTTPFSGNPPRHVSPNAEARDNRAKLPMWKQFSTGKVYKGKR